jgi:UDP:flavonoid glycosyltransferase YjiC (YdhE family)
LAYDDRTSILSRILIFAEAVTLAHVARPIALARILRELGHEVCIAAAPTADRWLEGEDVARWHIDSISSSQFLRALALGVPAYDAATLKRYVEDDLRAISAWSPDIVMGDFRLSLYISTRLARKPYGAIANAYWSRRYWSHPDSPSLVPLDWLPRAIADRLFAVAYPIAFSLHAIAFTRVCNAFGMTSPGPDIRDIYTASDATAFADVERFYEPGAAPAHEPVFIGPLAWEPTGSDSLPAFPEGRPIVFVALGSSGATKLLAPVVEALAALPVRCIVATGSKPSAPMPANCIHSAAFVPYAAACSPASLVLCNGGAPATYIALAHQAPVIGITSNLDQVLNMRTVERLGAGRAIPANRLRRGVVADHVTRVLAMPEAGQSASAASRWIMKSGCRTAIAAWLGRLSAPKTGSN